MTIRETLTEGLAAGLRERVGALKTVEVWDGSWDALASPRRFSFAAPAALVSLAGLVLSHRGQQPFHPRQLTRGEPPPPCPQVRLSIAVTFVSGDPSATVRAEEVLVLAEAALPVLIDFALEYIEGANLYTKALYETGMGAFALLGRRTVEIAPAQPDAVVPAGVRLVGASVRDEVTWPVDPVC